MDEDPPDEYTSTPLALRPVKVYRVDMTPSRWKKLSRKERDLVIAKACHRYDIQELADLPKLSFEAAKAQHPSKTNPYVKKGVAKHSAVLSSDLTTITDEAASLVDTPKSKGEATSLLSSLGTCDELLDLMEECSINDAIAEIKRVQIADCGGQPQFHEILPIFLRGTTLYIFVFKLNEELSAYPTIKYYIEGKPICAPYACTETNEQILEHCLRVVRSQKAMGDSKPPRIMIIGTHRDKEHECTTETRKDKNGKLANLLLPEFKKEVVYFRLRPSKELVFPLNAKILETMKSRLLTTFDD